MVLALFAGRRRTRPHPVVLLAPCSWMISGGSWYCGFELGRAICRTSISWAPRIHILKGNIQVSWSNIQGRLEHMHCLLEHLICSLARTEHCKGWNVHTELGVAHKNLGCDTKPTKMKIENYWCFFSFLIHFRHEHFLEDWIQFWYYAYNEIKAWLCFTILIPTIIIQHQKRELEFDSDDWIHWVSHR